MLGLLAWSVGAVAGAADGLDVVLLRHVAAAEEGDPDAIRLVLAALSLDSVIARRALARELDRRAPEGGGAVTAWALGLAAEPGLSRDERLDPWSLMSLRTALRAPSPPTRLAAAGSLGRIGDRDAGELIAELLVDPEIPAELEATVLLAIAGTNGPDLGRSRALLRRGGGDDWARAVEAVYLRWGTQRWPELTAALEEPDPSVRQAAWTTLLLLAEPASACAMIEALTWEEVPFLRRLGLQALAASAHPLARDHLVTLERFETEPALQRTAELLLEAWDQRAPGRSPAPLEPMLRGLLREAAGSSTLAQVEDRAVRAHLPLLEELLPRLPLREDPRWREEHARLAALRARLRCLDGIDCAPWKPRRRLRGGLAPEPFPER